MKHELPPLPYDYNALEPHIDEDTLRVHHDKHHAKYVAGFNKAEEMLREAREKEDFTVLRHWEREVAFHGAGDFLHTLYWENMTPEGAQEPPGGELGKRIDRDFGSFEKFRAHFKAAGEAIEASGWALLTYNQKTDNLQILTAENHQYLTQWLSVPILVCDVWEHAYYLKYQNKRTEYLDAFMKIINWNAVNNRFQTLSGCQYKSA
jgi:superoxide dismutase, Fe-Mn family